ncbi:hypothetical protein BP1258A_0346 [Burkholderia pseudomallei 1258a]|nr:hypothetical protein BP1258A_0346 [Burkholderia pseudomallei 1258a]EIF71182.1 hypothetical protein BP1258B_0439 [Burkholderia pseudomallei 1258b]
MFIAPAKKCLNRIKTLGTSFTAPTLDSASQ